MSILPPECLTSDPKYLAIKNDAHTKEWNAKKIMLLINSIVIVATIIITTIQIYLGIFPANYFWTVSYESVLPLTLITYLLVSQNT
ncbi:MAG: hypothetical protein JXA94_05735 [Parachlamydiales bacterium]|nr:hypothetical protein [Parachlamydiales bacterium]